MELIHILAVQQLTLLNCHWPYGRKLSRLWLQQVIRPGPHISRVVCLWAPEQVFCDVGSQEPQTLHLYHQGSIDVDRNACYFPFMFLGWGRTAFSAIIPYKMTFNKGSTVVQQASQQEDLPGGKELFSVDFAGSHHVCMGSLSTCSNNNNNNESQHLLRHMHLLCQADLMRPANV